MELSRIKALYCGLILQLLFTIALPLPYNKYGRTCSDIGCLSTQVCVMVHDACAYGKNEGKDCGRYPTCKRTGDPGINAGQSESAGNVYNDRPVAPSRGSPSAPPDDDVLGSLGLNPNDPYARPPPPQAPAPAYPRPQPNYPPSPSLYPSLPTDNYPGHRGGGGAGGGNGNYPAGGGSNYRPGGSSGFDGSGGHIVVPTPKPAAPASGGFFSGILSGVQNAFSTAIKQQVGTYINERLGIGPAAGGAAGGGAGGLGGILDARNFIDTKKFGLFNEKPASVTSDRQTAVNKRSTGGVYGAGPIAGQQQSGALPYPQQAFGPGYPGADLGNQARIGNPTDGGHTHRQPVTGAPTYGWKLN